MIGGRPYEDHTTLIKGGYVLTLDPALGDLPHTDVLIDGDKIAAIGPNLQASPHANVIDARDRIVMPGFVDTHRHTWQTPVRGVLPSCTLDQYFARSQDRHDHARQAGRHHLDSHGSGERGAGGRSGGDRGDLRGHVERRHRLRGGKHRDASRADRAVRHAAPARANSRGARSLAVERGRDPEVDFVAAGLTWGRFSAATRTVRSRYERRACARGYALCSRRAPSH